jgi:hypothetical protein
MQLFQQQIRGFLRVLGLDGLDFLKERVLES